MGKPWTTKADLNKKLIDNSICNWVTKEYFNIKCIIIKIFERDIIYKNNSNSMAVN